MKIIYFKNLLHQWYVDTRTQQDTKRLSISELILNITFQVRERLRVALERNTALEEELALTKEEVSVEERTLIMDLYNHLKYTATS